MPHIAVTMLPGRDMDKKKSLARKLRALVAEELGVDALIVSVSVEDIPLEGWDESMERVPVDAILIPEQETCDPWRCCCNPDKCS